MTNLKTKITAGLSAAAMLGTLVAPVAFADNTVVISGNGSDSNNTANITNEQSSEIVQKNKTEVGFVVNVTSNTGGNKANGNTGDGDVSIDTGNITNTISLGVTGGSNTATAPNCGCDLGDSDIKIKGNGEDSTNKSTVKNTKSSSVKQKNKTSVGASVTVKSKTGKNKANNNTGSGEVSVDTGTTTTTVSGSVTGNTNILN